MNPTSKSSSKTTRFPEERVRLLAQRLAHSKAQKDMQAIVGVDQMVADFEQLAIERGLPNGAYEVFEDANIKLALAYQEVSQRLADTAL